VSTKAPVRKDRRLPVTHRVPVLEPPLRGRLPFPRPVQAGLDEAAHLLDAPPWRLPGSLEDDDEHRPSESARRHARVEELVEKGRSLQDPTQRRPSPAGRGARLVATGGLHASALRHHRVERVVKARDRRAQARLEDRAHGFQAMRGRGKRPGAEPAGARRGVEAEPGAGDDREGALAADDERDQVRSARAALQLHDVARPRDALERGDHVFDLSVGARALPPHSGSRSNRRRCCRGSTRGSAPA